MNVTDFKNETKENQAKLLEEMCKLETLLFTYPITYEDVKTFAQWNYYKGLHNEKLKEFFINN